MTEKSDAVFLLILSSTGDSWEGRLWNSISKDKQIIIKMRSRADHQGSWPIQAGLVTNYCQIYSFKHSHNNMHIKKGQIFNEYCPIYVFSLLASNKNLCENKDGFISGYKYFSKGSTKLELPWSVFLVFLASCIIFLFI